MYLRPAYNGYKNYAYYHGTFDFVRHQVCSDYTACYDAEPHLDAG
jgi:hypothetical protein